MLPARRLCLQGFLVIVLAHSAAAQEGSTLLTTLWVVQHVEVEPTREAQFEAAWRARALAARQAKIAPPCAWFVSKGVLAVGKFDVAFPVGSFSDLNHPETPCREALERAAGREKTAEWDVQEQQAIRQVRQTVTILVPELGYAPKQGASVEAPVGYLHYGVDYVKPAMLPQYRRVISEFSKALEKISHPIGYEVYEVLYGATHSFVFLWRKESAEQHHRTHDLPRYVLEALGPEGLARLGKEWRECLWDFESYGRIPRPELSYFSESAP